ncbi:prepilin peptidase [Micromonospora sp. WMMD998]|uniref:prepilin peptidase n=1 Tax=Micromonospora sp. WMMD998 TaxID=3016092 RepID=UPI00249C5B06|nr:prepilin peptidase [Micromonospora sp. WMMD998]WFE38057.1 prepilin peptidase [Micromonospora sp. WMMD998]
MTNGVTAIGLGLAGAMAGVPIAAVAYGTGESGPVRLPAGWWTGSPARPTEVIVTALLAATAAAVTGVVIPLGVTLPAYWLFAVVGVCLAIIDVRCRRLPHRLTGSLWVSSGLLFIIASLVRSDVGPLLRAACAGIAAAAIMLTIALALPGQLGLGDVVFVGVIAFNLGWLGWHTATLGFLAGLLLHGTIASVVRIRRSNDVKNPSIPMGPALAAGWVLAVVLAA